MTTANVTTAIEKLNDSLVNLQVNTGFTVKLQEVDTKHWAAIVLLSVGTTPIGTLGLNYRAVGAGKSCYWKVGSLRYAVDLDTLQNSMDVPYNFA